MRPNRNAVAILLLLCTSVLLGQRDSTAAVDTTQSFAIVSEAPLLPDLPNAEDIAKVLADAAGRSDEVIQEIVSKRDKAISGLSELLNSPASSRSSSPPDSERVFLTDKVLVVGIIARTASPRSVEVLMQAAESHPDPLIRGAALAELATRTHEAARLGALIPQREVVRILIEHLTDEYYIPQLQQPMSRIAQEGLIRWLGLDFGDPQFEEARTKAVRNREISQPNEFARIWWAKNVDRLVWKPSSAQFKTN